jgi:hypothetical protein
MKKLIDKLFEWLGYVPKDEYIYYKNSLEMRKQMDFSFVSQDVTYYVSNSRDGCCVVALIGLRNRRVIKVFLYKLYDADYARICAEELCDMLNEKF